MTRRDRIFAAYRARALAAPRTRANGIVLPEIALPGGTYLGLSFNL
jgi:hypothetical protein